MTAPLILGTNSIKDTGYNVANSLRLDGSDAYLIRTLGQAGTSNKAFTFSCWIKRSKRNTDVPRLIHMGGDGASPTHYISVRFRDDQNGRLSFYTEANGGGFQLNTNRLFRDESAWYHIVVAVNSADSTESNRQRMYVNGVEETSFSSSTAMSLNFDLGFNDSGDKIYLFRKQQDSDHFPGYACEVAFLDGQQLAPTAFGEFDEDSPTIWKPKDFKDDVTFGTNGFYLEFKDSSALGDDTSGNGNDFTVASIASTDQSTDTCTNNFATMNSIDNLAAGSAFSEGNLKIVTTSGNITYNTSTIGFSSGKWYMETKLAGSAGYTVGVVRGVSTANDSNNKLGERADGFSYDDGGEVKNNGSTLSGSFDSYSSGDIIGVYADLDNNKLYFSKNGTLQNSGTGLTLTAGTYFFAVGDNNASNSSTYEVNFGGTNTYSVSSGNTDGTYGNFEYSTTITGDGASKTFKALNTKNLAEFG